MTDGSTEKGARGSSTGIEELLVPVDGSEESMTAVEYALAIAERYSARIHALYVLDREIAADLAAGVANADALAARSEEFIGSIRTYAPENVSITASTAYGFSPTQKTRHPGSVIVDAAADAAVDFLVIPREPYADPTPAGNDERTDTDADTLSRAAEYVLQYAEQPVLSV